MPYRETFEIFGDVVRDVRTPHRATSRTEAYAAASRVWATTDHENSVTKHVWHGA